MRYSLTSLLLIFCLVVPIAHVQAADKETIGVSEIKSNIRGSDPDTFRVMLETQLTKTRKFEVIERERLGEIFKEQAMDQFGPVDGDNTLGGITGLDYLVYGSITKLGAKKSGGSFGGVAVGSSAVEMSVDIKLVDTATGRIVIAESVEQSINAKSGFAMKGYGNVSSGGDALGDVQKATAMAIASKIVLTIFPIKIIAIQGDGTIILNYGDSTLSPGDRLAVFEVGEGFVDPDTGETLGAEETEIGFLKVHDAQAKFSKATLSDGGPVVKGNTARIVAQKGKKKKKKRF